MKKMVHPLLSSPGERFFLPLTLMRVAFGLFYCTSGINKVFVTAKQASMLQTLTDAGIPFPEVMTPFVALCEMAGGLMLALGLFTRFWALVLLVISAVALLTVAIYQIPGGLDLHTWYSWLLYLPESGYLLICIMLLVQGCGPWGIDRWLLQRGQETMPGG